MTSKSETAIDYRRCPDGKRHEWEYKGKAASSYVCWACDLRVTKASLKEHTDA